VVEAPDLTLMGQVTSETSVVAIKVKVAVWVEPLRVAVRVADRVVVMAAAVAENVAEELLAGTVTDAATGSAVLLLESATELPPVGAA